MNLSYKNGSVQKGLKCYHCGEKYSFSGVLTDDKNFCCEGCKLVYELLRDNNLCTYYNLNEGPGITPVEFNNSEKYAFLNDEKTSKHFIRFVDSTTSHVAFTIPKIHCSSCIWLLENLHRLNPAIISSTVNFLKKEIIIVYDSSTLKLSQVASLLMYTGYEPAIHLSDLTSNSGTKTKNKFLKIGIAGFCFGNIMMLSFPEYFASGNFYDQKNLSLLFNYLNLILAIPVFFYCASDFFVSAWKSLRNRYLNIDGPIALAIVITFARSVYEILSHTGSGYMDSMSGIVFFMLIGRYFQNFTYDHLSFERDYKSYFPIGVTIRTESGDEKNVSLSDLKKNTHIVIHNNEIIPTDAILLSQHAHIDYSFITGESNLVKKQTGDLIYAGGKQVGGLIELQVENTTAQSYLTQLWNKDGSVKEEGKKHSTTEQINKYFTIAVLSISGLAGLFWWLYDPSKALNALTAVLIVACPCGLLLTSTFAKGNILRIFLKNKFYLKNADVIDHLSEANSIVFDKTGTITKGSKMEFVGKSLDTWQKIMIASLARQSSHPLSRQLYAVLKPERILEVVNFIEIPGEGLEGNVDGMHVKLGSSNFVTSKVHQQHPVFSQVFVSINGVVYGHFNFSNAFRPGLKTLVTILKNSYKLRLLSGDNDSEKKNILEIFGTESTLLFNQKPEDKLIYIQKLQQEGEKVIMLGDGLNDAGALRQSNVGIAVSDDINNFSPACDAILDGSELSKLPEFISLAKSGKKVILITFLFSLIYNLIGLFFAVQGTLSPVIAAILMPISSVSIVLIATTSTTLIGKMRGL
jgi:Cu+-exporting ATPase